jgi:hypothetical protein
MEVEVEVELKLKLKLRLVRTISSVLCLAHPRA